MDVPLGNIYIRKYPLVQNKNKSKSVRNNPFYGTQFLMTYTKKVD
jgi:hypothetical protein